MIPCQRHLFDLPEGVTYLNCAYMSPLMNAAAEAGVGGMRGKQHPWKIRPEDFFSGSEVLRVEAARMFGAEANDIAIVGSASYGIAAAALNLPMRKGQKILLLDEQFPSNVYSWRRVAQQNGADVVSVPWPEDGDWTAGVLRRLDKDVAIAALPHVQWTSGGVLDLGKIGKACRDLGCALVLDLTQSLGVVPFDVKQVQPAFAVAATYKWLLGPYSLGVLYVAPEWQNGRPLEENWIQRENARNFSSLILYTDGYEAGARRFDMGERSNFALAPAASVALQQISSWGIPEIAATTRVLSDRLIKGAERLGLTAWAERFRAPHYLCLRSNSPIPTALTDRLAEKSVFVSVRGSSIRITPHVYNSEADIDRLLDVMDEALRG
jgi:selenocysteine lyase/cysteine desulfurase